VGAVEHRPPHDRPATCGYQRSFVTVRVNQIKIVSPNYLNGFKYHLEVVERTVARRAHHDLSFASPIRYAMKMHAAKWQIVAEMIRDDMHLVSTLGRRLGQLSN
jgi:hypothetical protein